VLGYPAIVPQIVQKRAPEGSGAPQPLHLPAAAAAIGVAAAIGAAAGAGAAGEAEGRPAGGAACCGAPFAPAAGGGAGTSDAPQDGHTFQAGSSTILRQAWQRLGLNGSTAPQYGQAAAILSMNFPQYGHACL
jgi:hypothetical protein